MFLPDWLKAIFTVVILVFMALGYAARRRPDVQWLQPFDLFRHLTPEQRERMRRRANTHAGIEMIFVGLLIPVGYLILNVMFFSSMSWAGIAIAGGLSIVCIAFGIMAIRSR